MEKKYVETSLASFIHESKVTEEYNKAVSEGCNCGDTKTKPSRPRPSRPTKNVEIHSEILEMSLTLKEKLMLLEGRGVNKEDAKKLLLEHAASLLNEETDETDEEKTLEDGEVVSEGCVNEDEFGEGAIDDTDITDETSDVMPESSSSKMEIKEFILRVDDIEEAKRELDELGISVEPASEGDDIEMTDEIVDDIDEVPGEDISVSEELPMEDNIEEGIEDEITPAPLDEPIADEPTLDTVDGEENIADEMPEDNTLMDDMDGGEIKISTEGWTAEQFNSFNKWLAGYGLDAEKLLGGDLEMETVETEDLKDDTNGIESTDTTTDIPGDGIAESAEQSLGDELRTKFRH